MLSSFPSTSTRVRHLPSPPPPPPPLPPPWRGRSAWQTSSGSSGRSRATPRPPPPTGWPLRWSSTSRYRYRVFPTKAGVEKVFVSFYLANRTLLATCKIPTSWPLSSWTTSSQRTIRCATSMYYVRVSPEETLGHFPEQNMRGSLMYPSGVCYARNFL